MPDGDTPTVTPGSSSGTASPAAKPATTRDPYLDNARGILILLVVIGHTLESFASDAGYLGGAIYTWAYSFHMPAFVMISGYLSRSYRNEPRQVRRLLSAMLVPYLIFQVIHILMKVVLHGSDLSLDLVNPTWTLWFLLTLFVWRMITPLFRVLRYPIVFAVAIAVIVPLDEGLDGTLSLGRIVGMLPFFVIGLAATPEVLARVKAFRARWLGALVLLGAFTISLLTHERFPASLFFLDSNYQDMDLSLPVAMAMRVAILVTGTVGSIAILLITPRERTWCTDLGFRSLTIYLLHPLLLMPIRYLDQPPSWSESWWATVLLVLLGAAITFVVSRGVVSSATRWLTDPPIGQLLVRDDPPAATGRRAAR